MMLHPSYTDLMKVVNSNVEIGEEPVVNSRDSIVLATAKRARQIIGGEEPLIDNASNKKPFSIAVEELYSSRVKIVGEEEAAEDGLGESPEEAGMADMEIEMEMETEPGTETESDPE